MAVRSNRLSCFKLSPIASICRISNIAWWVMASSCLYAPCFLVLVFTVLDTPVFVFGLAAAPIPILNDLIMLFLSHGYLASLIYHTTSDTHVVKMEMD